ncbi:MAG: ATP-binding domain-containing protein [Vicinamibacteria bacterium]|nr:ATP-binding domain-containing protein [Vicinamibacteria bacterium]
MAKMIPDVPTTDHRFQKSPGEAAVYTAMRRLPDSIVVIHGLATLMRHEDDDAPEEGEIDFVVLDPTRGMLVLEVKGGDVSYDPNTDIWTVAVKRNRKTKIRDPALRAANRFRDLEKMLKKDPGWSSLGLSESPGGHAVLFSALDDVQALIRPNMPAEIAGGLPTLADFPTWLDGVYEYHGAHAPPGPDWVTHAKHVLARPFEVKSRIGVTVALDNRRLDYWTDQQWQALQGLRHMRNVGVAGGAGTGKTLLAVRRAQELARAGEHTLLLCFNAVLGDQLKRERKAFLQAEPEAGAHLWMMTFHDLCGWWVEDVSSRSKRDFFAEARLIAPGQDEVHVIRPVALALAIDHERPSFRAIVLDEAQDFRDDYWTPLKLLQEAPGMRQLVFYDVNQRLLHRTQKIPYDLTTSYVLSKNCRNGQAIHDAAYKHYQGPDVAGNECDGEIQRWEEPDFDSAVERLLSQLLRLVVVEKVPPEEIVVLLLDARLQERCEAALEQRLKDRRLRLSFRVHFETAQGRVRVDTVGRFKGMEAAVVILWAQGWPEDEEERSFLYVGLSRARSLLVVLGPSPLVERALGALQVEVMPS